MSYICKNCNYTTLKWTGRCPSCGEWSTIIENNVKTKKNKRQGKIPRSYSLQSIANNKKNLYQTTNIKEVDNVLGGGIISSSVILLSGEPGIGKSTLILQLLNAISDSLYISGEETDQQILLRAQRLKIDLNQFTFLNETNLENIIAVTEKEKPNLLIIDSIQTIASEAITNEAGNITQVRLCTNKLIELGAKNNIPIIIIGHLTKDGNVAGPKTLEHLVDVVLHLEGDPHYGYRTLRSSKNRYGSTAPMGLFEMTSQGLEEIKDPTLFFLENKIEDNQSSIFSLVTKGQKPFVVEIQALVSKTVFGYPQRKSLGFDLKRLQMLIAILHKKLNIPLNDQDVYLNITGGLKVNDMGADLAVAAAILNSFHDFQQNDKLLALGEIGLNGEIRSIPQINDKIKNALNLGFKNICLPLTAQKKIKKNLTSKVKFIKDLKAFHALFH